MTKHIKALAKHKWGHTELRSSRRTDPSAQTAAAWLSSGHHGWQERETQVLRTPWWSMTCQGSVKYTTNIPTISHKKLRGSIVNSQHMSELMYFQKIRSAILNAVIEWNPCGLHEFLTDYAHAEREKLNWRDLGGSSHVPAPLFQHKPRAGQTSREDGTHHHEPGGYNKWVSSGTFETNVISLDSLCIRHALHDTHASTTLQLHIWIHFSHPHPRFIGLYWRPLWFEYLMQCCVLTNLNHGLGPCYILFKFRSGIVVDYQLPPRLLLRLLGGLKFVVLRNVPAKGTHHNHSNHAGEKQHDHERIDYGEPVNLIVHH